MTDWHDKAIQDWLNGDTLQAVGDRYGVTRQAVHYIIRSRGVLENRPHGHIARPLAVALAEGLLPNRSTDECWEWQKSRTNRGYGRMHGDRLTHRLAWEVAFGEIPKGMHVLHRCDNPPCCNPAHLFLGTHADNMKDRDAKGRARWGTHKR